MDEKKLSWGEQREADQQDPTLEELAVPPHVSPEEVSEEDKATLSGKEAQSGSKKKD